MRRVFLDAVEKALDQFAFVVPGLAERPHAEAVAVAQRARDRDDAVQMELQEIAAGHLAAALKRHRPGQAVIILSARGEENDRVRGLVNGADDYVVKPFSMKELLARVDAVLRRTCERSAPADQRSLPGGTADFSQRVLVFDDGRREELSERETALLRYLMDSRGRLVTREEILRQVWGLDPNRTETRTIDMHIMHLRSKLGDKGQQTLETVRGQGYRFLTSTPE